MNRIEGLLPQPWMDEEGDMVILYEHAAEAMKEYAKQALELAAERAEFTYNLPTDYKEEKAGFKLVATKDSILNIIKELK